MPQEGERPWTKPLSQKRPALTSSTGSRGASSSAQPRAGMEGKKGDGLAVEAACGALAAAIAINGEDDSVTNALSMFAFMVSTRGMAYVHERAARHMPQENAA